MDANCLDYQFRRTKNFLKKRMQKFQMSMMVFCKWYLQQQTMNFIFWVFFFFQLLYQAKVLFELKCRPNNIFLVCNWKLKFLAMFSSEGILVSETIQLYWTRSQDPNLEQPILSWETMCQPLNKVWTGSQLGNSFKQAV